MRIATICNIFNHRIFLGVILTAWQVSGFTQSTCIKRCILPLSIQSDNNAYIKIKFWVGTGLSLFFFPDSLKSIALEQGIHPWLSVYLWLYWPQSLALLTVLISGNQATFLPLVIALVTLLQCIDKSCIKAVMLLRPPFASCTHIRASEKNTFSYAFSGKW